MRSGQRRLQLHSTLVLWTILAQLDLKLLFTDGRGFRSLLGFDYACYSFLSLPHTLATIIH